MPFRSTKTYGHEVGFSTAFRQWKAASHCNKIHGYALAFKFIFECTELDDRNWCLDFGNFKSLKTELEKVFDHKCVVAQDDPHLEWFQHGHDIGILDLMTVERIGCESFAQLAYSICKEWLYSTDQNERVHIVSVEASEHGANSAIYLP